MPATRCNATTTRGTPCGSFADPVTGLCRVHDPARQQDVAESRHRAGKGRSSAARARRELLQAGTVSADEMLALLVVTAKRLSRGNVEPGVASAMASLTRSWFAGRSTQLLENLERELSEGAKR